MGIQLRDTEHLPMENTLLIHYTISGFGLWDFVQRYCGYRNVCDDEWTLMIPNHQHPRHSDAPFRIGSGQAFHGIYAWNYGGIPGVRREHFDDSHSYLVQLTIYDQLGCQSGVPPGTTGVQPPTGLEPPTSGIINFHPSPIVPPFRPRNRRDPPTSRPPWPAVPVPVGVGSPNSGSGEPTGEPPACVPPTSPSVGPTTPCNLSPNPVNLPSLPVAGTPTATSYNPNPIPTPSSLFGFTSPRPNRIGLLPAQSSLLHERYVFSHGQLVGLEPMQLEPQVGVSGQIGRITLTAPFEEGGLLDTGSPPSRSLLNISPTFVSRTGQYVSRISQELGASPRDSRFLYQYSVRVPAAPSTSLSHNWPGSSEKYDLGQAQNFSEGDFLSTSSRLDVSTNRPDSHPLGMNQVDGENDMGGVTLRIEVGREEIPYGEPAVISASLVPNAGVEIRASLTLYFKDSSGRNVKLESTEVQEVSESMPLKASTLARTDIYSPGRSVAIAVAHDDDGRVIKSASHTVVIRNPLQQSYAGVRQDRIRTTYEGWNTKGPPIPLSNLLDLGPGTEFFLEKDKSFEVLAESVSGRRDFSFLAQAADANQLSLEVLDTSSLSVSGQTSKEVGTTLASTKDRVKLDGVEFQPDTHVVGLLPKRMPTDLLTVRLRRAGNTPNQTLQGTLYLGKDYGIRGSSLDVVRTSPTGVDITATTPFPETPIRLLVNGPESGRIPSDATIYEGQTNKSGVTMFTGVSATPNEFVSLIHPGNGSFHPLRFKFYSQEVF